MPDPNTRTAAHQAAVAVLSCCTRCSICSNYASDLGGAKEIRTPDLLHAIWRQHVHPRPSPQVTVLPRPHECARVRVSCCTSVLYSPTRRQRPAASRTACPSTSSLRRPRHLSPEKRCWCRCTTSLCRPGGLRPPVNRRTSCSVNSLIRRNESVTRPHTYALPCTSLLSQQSSMAHRSCDLGRRHGKRGTARPVPRTALSHLGQSQRQRS